MHGDAFDTASWPWEHERVRILPVLHGRLEFARAVLAHLDAIDPQVVVVEVPRLVGSPWLDAVRRLPAIHALRIDIDRETRWLVVEPTDAAVEAARWCEARGRQVVAADLLVSDYPDRRELFPDPAVMLSLGYARYVEKCTEAPTGSVAAAADPLRERALAAAALEASARGARVAVVCGLAHARSILEEVRRGCATPLFREPSPQVGVVPVESASLGEVLAEMPFIAACWERARTAGTPCAYESPAGKVRPRARVLSFPGTPARARDETPAVDRDLEIEERDKNRGDDLLARPRLLYRLVQHAERFARETSGSEPTLAERRVLHRYANALAAISGRVCPDLYEMVVAARGAVDDSFARDLLRVATLWPWASERPGSVRLSASDVGNDSRLVTLRPRIDRISRRPSLAQALRRFAESPDGQQGICSHVPEDIVIEGLGAQLQRQGGTRASRAGTQVVPFTASLLDGIDARETLRRYIVDGRPWVKEEIAVRAKVGAVVVIFDEDDDDDEGASERFPWCQVWHGEHQNESDMAFYATDPAPGLVAPGIHRTEYGGLLMIWPPLGLGDIWSDPAYAFCVGKYERLLVAALDYTEQPLVVYVAPRPPRTRLLALAGRLGKRVVHVPPGTLSRDVLRRVRTFHVLADKRLRPIAEALIDPP